MQAVPVRYKWNLQNYSPFFYLPFSLQPSKRDDEIRRMTSMWRKWVTCAEAEDFPCGQFKEENRFAFSFTSVVRILETLQSLSVVFLWAFRPALGWRKSEITHTDITHISDIPCRRKATQKSFRDKYKPPRAFCFIYHWEAKKSRRPLFSITCPCSDYHRCFLNCDVLENAEVLLAPLFLLGVLAGLGELQHCHVVRGAELWAESIDLLAKSLPLMYSIIYSTPIMQQWGAASKRAPNSSKPTPSCILKDPMLSVYLQPGLCDDITQFLQETYAGYGLFFYNSIIFFYAKWFVKLRAALLLQRHEGDTPRCKNSHHFRPLNCIPLTEYRYDYRRTQIWDAWMTAFALKPSTIQ